MMIKKGRSNDDEERTRWYLNNDDDDDAELVREYNNIMAGENIVLSDAMRVSDTNGILNIVGILDKSSSGF